LDTAEAIHPASSPARYCVGAAGGGRGGPEPAGGPGEDQQRDDSGHDPRTTRGLSLEFIVRPSDRAARRGFVSEVGCGFAADISDAPPGGEQERRPTPLRSPG
jgi:hypothetical protein